MPVITPPSSTAKAKSKKKVGFWESQRLAKQKAYYKQIHKKKIKLDDMTLFTQQLASMLDAGLPLMSALDSLREQTSDPVFALIIKEVRGEVAAGSNFSDAIKKFPNAFPSLFISMVEAGEASGALSDLMAKVGTYFESTNKLIKKIKGAMAYPIAVISLAIILVNVLLIFVIPVFAEMFHSFNAELPKPTLILIGISDFLKGNIVYILAGLGISVYFLRRYMKTPMGRVVKDKVLYRVPIVGELIRKLAISRFSRTYAVLMRSGVPILRAIEICSAISNNTYMQKDCDEMIKQVSQGGQISDVIKQSKYFPPLVANMARAGEQTGDIEHMMTKVSDFYDVEIDRTVGSLTSLIEPFLIIGLGIVIGAIVMAMFLPIFELSSVIKA